jgi:hypothetical protein
MGNNRRVRQTTTTSVSFDREMFEFMEQQRHLVRLDRSQYLRELLEKEYHQVHGKAAVAALPPQATTRNGVPLLTVVASARRVTTKMVKQLEEELS